MIVVSDSTPLITLMKATRLDVLHDLFGEVVIPEAVFQELTANDNYPDEARLISDSDFFGWYRSGTGRRFLSYSVQPV